MITKNYFVFSHFDFLQSSAGTTRMQYYAKAIANDKNKVYLVSCCSTEFSAKNFIEIAPNIFVLKEKTLTKNPFQIFRFVKRLWKFAKKKNGQSVFLHYPFPLVFLELFSIFFLKFIKRESLYTEFNEIRKYTSNFHAKATISRPKYSLKKFLFKTVFTLNEPLLSAYNGIVCISTSIEDYAKKYNDNCLRVPILTNPDLEIEKKSQKYSIPNTVNIGFSGSIHPTKENLENFINIINQLKKDGYQVSFNLCGPIFSDYRKRFEERCINNDELSYFGNLNSKQLSSFLSDQDLVVLPRGYSLQNKYGFSTKLSDYLNHQKLIVVTDVSDNKLYIKDGFNGFVVPPDNDSEMKKKLVYILDNINKLSENVIPNTLKTSQEHFYYRNYGEPLRQFLE